MLDRWLEARHLGRRPCGGHHRPSAVDQPDAAGDRRNAGGDYCSAGGDRESADAFAQSHRCHQLSPPDFDPTRAAWQDIDEALKKAAVDNEPVLIDFGATWCPNCAQLDQSFQAPQVQRMVKPLHRVRVDTGPREAWTNLDIATAYGLDLYKTGIPGLVLLSPLGKVEATTNDGLFDNDLPNSPSEIIGFLKPHL